MIWCRGSYNVCLGLFLHFLSPSTTALAKTPVLTSQVFSTFTTSAFGLCWFSSHLSSASLRKEFWSFQPLLQGYQLSTWSTGFNLIGTYLHCSTFDPSLIIEILLATNTWYRALSFLMYLSTVSLSVPNTVWSTGNSISLFSIQHCINSHGNSCSCEFHSGNWNMLQWINSWLDQYQVDVHIATTIGYSQIRHHSHFHWHRQNDASAHRTHLLSL